MKFKTTTRAMIAMLAVGLSVETAPAQLPSGLPGGLSGGASGSAGGAAAIDRAQAQVQQRVQAQVQQRLQTQVQARVQAQSQTRIQTESKRAAEIAARASARARRLADTATETAPNGVQLNLGVSAASRTRANAADNSANLNTNARFGLGASAALPQGISDADVAIYDNIFGQFNPLRPCPTSSEGETSGTPKETASKESKSASQTPVAQESNQEPQSERSSGGLASSSLDFATRIHVAARQRRAEISQLRDQAVATGNTELLLKADALERRLNAFAFAQAEIQAKVQSDVDARYEATAETATNAIARGAAYGQSQTRVLSQDAQQLEGQAMNEVGAASEFEGRVQINNRVEADAKGQLKAETTPAARVARRPSNNAGAPSSGSSSASPKAKK